MFALREFESRGGCLVAILSRGTIVEAVAC